MRVWGFLSLLVRMRVGRVGVVLVHRIRIWTWKVVVNLLDRSGYLLLLTIKNLRRDINSNRNSIMKLIRHKYLLEENIHEGRREPRQVRIRVSNSILRVYDWQLSKWGIIFRIHTAGSGLDTLTKGWWISKLVGGRIREERGFRLRLNLRWIWIQVWGEERGQCRIRSQAIGGIPKAKARTEIGMETETRIVNSSKS